MTSRNAGHSGALSRFVAIRTAVTAATANEPLAIPLARLAVSRRCAAISGLMNLTSVSRQH
jgi:hypothetical protein